MYIFSIEGNEVFKELFAHLLEDFSDSRWLFLDDLTYRFINDEKFAQKGEMKDRKKDYAFIRACLEIIERSTTSPGFQAMPDGVARYVSSAYTDTWAVFQRLPRE